MELEPLTTLIKLAILNYKKEGTKISIYNNSLFLQEPSYYQGIVRYCYNDSRNDLLKLELPIQQGLNWFAKNSNNKDDIDYILKKSISGLLKLSKSYQEDSKIYKDILELSQIIQNFVYEELLTSNSLLEHIDKVWKDKNEFSYIKNIFEDIDKYLKEHKISDISNMYDSINSNLHPIENILQRKDVLFISKLNSTHCLITN